MLRNRKEKQQGMEVVILEQMVPENHLLRKIDRSIDFSFINKLCAPLYSENVGRPAVEPEVLFRMLFVGYLYGIRSERRLEEEINYNFAYKWFCGLGLTEKAPDATTISKECVKTCSWPESQCLPSIEAMDLELLVMFCIICCPWSR